MLQAHISNNYEWVQAVDDTWHENTALALHCSFVHLNEEDSDDDTSCYDVGHPLQTRGSTVY